MGRLQRKTAGRWTSWIFSYYHESSTVSRTHHAKSTIDELSDEASRLRQRVERMRSLRLAHMLQQVRQPVAMARTGLPRLLITQTG